MRCVPIAHQRVSGKRPSRSALLHDGCYQTGGLTMKYAVKEIYYTLQGEGINVGRPAVFLRFAGCNLWSGREADRATAVCQFCDTDFVGTNGPGGGLFVAADILATAVASVWPSNGCGGVHRLVVCT